MTSRQAYEIILESIAKESDLHVVNKFFDEVNFGNFFISWTSADAERTLVCDKSQLILCHDLEGLRNCKMIAPTLEGLDDVTLLRALMLH
jgi:hypothetical protein